MRQVRIFLLSMMVILLVILSAGCSHSSSSIMTDCSPDEIRANALTLYADGDIDAATYQMALYLQENNSDTDAMRTLIDWYTEIGETAYAEKYIKMLGEYVNLLPRKDIVLSGEIDSELVVSHISNIKLEIYPVAVRSKQIVLTVTGKNLFSGGYEENEYLGAEAEGWRTSDWFFVDDTQEYLTISGGFNRAVWQFELLDGERILSGDETKTYRVSNSNEIKNLATATTVIPEKAVRCRIAYAFEPDGESDTLDERVQIEYGMFPSDYEPYSINEIEIPDMIEGDSVVYKNGTWKLVSGGAETVIDLGEVTLKKGDTISVTASLAAVVTVDTTEAEINTAGVYGVSWSNADSSILLERTDDAVGLSFNYLSGDSWAGPYDNDFDNIYPWSEIALCTIDDAGNITYEDEEGFATDGSAGNVFVEIPKHYVCREVVDGVEYIAISGTPREGFELDPSFQRESGEVDHIYIAAYMTSLLSGTAESVSGKLAETNYSMAELREYMADMNQSNTGNYSEIDLFAVQTVQRLFLIETGVRNSQVFWIGEVSKAYLSLSAPQQYALNDMNNSNTIVITNSSLNRRFQIGDGVCICTYEQFFGSRKYDNYYSRTITNIELSETEIIISFDGEPLNIISGTTQIAHVADVNGKTDELQYHSGSSGDNDGLTAFRYRFIENLWGNGFVYVEGVEVLGQTIQITYPNGYITELSYDLALQQESPGQTENVDYGKMNIVSFGYDEDNPLVMLPDMAGASCSTSFCDTIYLGFADRWDKRTVCMVWGGTWDLRTSCGLFCYRFLALNTDYHRENSSRMMFWFSD